MTFEQTLEGRGNQVCEVRGYKGHETGEGLIKLRRAPLYLRHLEFRRRQKRGWTFVSLTGLSLHLINEFIYSFMHAFNTYLSNTCYVPGIVIEAEDIYGNEQRR